MHGCEAGSHASSLILILIYLSTAIVLTPGSSSTHPVTVVKHPVAVVKHLVAVVKHRVAVVKHPVAVVKHQVAVIHSRWQ